MERSTIGEWVAPGVQFLTDLPRPVVILDVAGHLMYANPAAEQLVFPGGRALIGRCYDDSSLFGIPADSPGTRPLAEVLESRSAVIGAEFDVESERVGHLRLRVNAIPLYSELGGMVGVGLLIDDRTEDAARLAEGEWLRSQLVENRIHVERLLALSEALNEIGQIVNSTLDVENMLQRVVERSTVAAGADSAVLEMEDAGRWSPRVAVSLPPAILGRRLPPAEAQHAVIPARTREPYVVADARGEQPLDRDLMNALGKRALVAVPLPARDGDPVGGVLSLQRDEPVPFESYEVGFVTRVATTLSLAIENRRIHAEEHHIADTLQRALLSVPRHVSGIDFSYTYRSATEAAWIGGDFFDLFKLPGSRVGLLIGDVSGKGVEASALASFTRQLVRAQAQDTDSPAQAIERTNDLVFRGSQTEDYVTMFFGILHLPDGAFTYCNAGHPLPIVAGEGRLDCLSGGGPIVGAWPGASYEDVETSIGPRDTLVMYTDGVIEAKRDSQLFGQERMLAVVRGLKRRPVDDMPPAIVSKASAFARGRLRDDIAVLCVRPQAR